MNYDFNALVNRKGVGNLKEFLLSDDIRQKGMIAFAGAEMDFKTAPSIIKAVVERAENGLFGFTLKDDNYLSSVKWWMEKARNWSISEEWIVPTLGTIHSVATAIRMTTKEGEGIIVQPPVYYRYEQAATRLNRKTVYNPLIFENGQYKMDFEDLERHMADENNKLFVLCNPHNPIAKVWGEEELKKIASLSKKYKKVVFSDEIFAEVTFDGHVTTPYSSIEGAEDYAIVSTSLGKTFNFTGVNHANMIIQNKTLRDAFIKQRDADHYGSMDPLIHAAVCGAYNKEGLKWVREVCNYIHGNIKYLQEYFSSYFSKIHLLPIEGSYVAWIDMRDLGLSEKELMDFLEKEAFLYVDPGNEYGAEGNGFIRMNIATPRKELEKAMYYLTEAMNKRGY